MHRKNESILQKDCKNPKGLKYKYRSNPLGPDIYPIFDDLNEFLAKIVVILMELSSIKLKIIGHQKISVP